MRTWHVFESKGTAQRWSSCLACLPSSWTLLELQTSTAQTILMTFTTESLENVYYLKKKGALYSTVLSSQLSTLCCWSYEIFFAQIMISWQRPCRGKASAPTPRPHLAPTGVNHAGHSLLADLADRLFWRHLCLLSPSTSLLHHILSASRNVSVWRDSKLYL